MATRSHSTRTGSSAVKSGRRPLQTVTTNTSHYNKSDPFAAFNSLRKLLSLLPSKLGGCQYKFTPEEHKLSMHLISIVEPFIGPSPSKPTITRQPTEILDNIAFFVDSKRDLLSLALTCQRMHSIVFPRHFDYRVIRVRVSSIRIWSHLVTHRAFARNVRRLEILDERDSNHEIVPPGIPGSDTDVESTDDELCIHVKEEKLLIAALGKMCALTSFKWFCNHSLVSMDSVWPTLLKCQLLNQVEINDNSMFIPLVKDEEDTGAKLPRKAAPAILPSLTSISLRSTKASYGITKHPNLSRVSDVLHHCPNIQLLQIGYDSRRLLGYFQPTADDFFLCGSWKSLTTLILSHLWCSRQGLDSLSNFLFSHPNIEVLHLDIDGGTLLPIPNSLPRLRELKSNRYVATAIMGCAVEQPRPLEVIKGVKLSGSKWDSSFLKTLKLTGKKVARIELSGWNEMDDIRSLADCVPQLSWLDLGKRNNENVHKTTIPNNVTEWTNLVSHLPELVTLHGVRFFYEVPPGAPGVSDRSKVRKNDETAPLLAWKCPKLRRLDHWEEGSSKVIILVRDDEKLKFEVRRIKTDTKTYD